MNRLRVSGVVAASALLWAAPAHAVTVISQGYVVPETISQAPAGFGGYGGSFFIPDFSTDKIMVMPAGGGSPSVFQQATPNITGGLFLPPGFGASGGQFIVVGRTSSATGQITAYDSAGNATAWGSSPQVGGLSIPAIAPGNFGSYGGQLFVSDTRGVAVFGPAGTYSPFVTELPFGGNGAFGIAFAPSGFGNVGGSLLVGNAGQVGGTSDIVAIDAAGNVSPFASINLLPGQVGLRQMAFAPDNFGQYGGMLFVSVSGSTQGGGALGSLLVLDGLGEIVATLKLGTELDKFDPRGLFFLDDGELLIADAADPILLATAADFRATPLPGTLAMLVLGGLPLLARRRLRPGT